MMTIMDKVIELLLSKGFTPQGQTQTETVRLVTRNSYPLAGKETTLGGRQRFVLPGTSKRVTVGKRVVCIYQVDGNKAWAFQNFKASDLEGIEAALSVETLPV